MIKIAYKQMAKNKLKYKHLKTTYINNINKKQYEKTEIGVCANKWLCNILFRNNIRYWKEATSTVFPSLSNHIDTICLTLK